MGRAEGVGSVRGGGDCNGHVAGSRACAKSCDTTNNLSLADIYRPHELNVFHTMVFISRPHALIYKCNVVKQIGHISY
jgi:hypothetical protein